MGEGDPRSCYVVRDKSGPYTTGPRGCVRKGEMGSSHQKPAREVTGVQNDRIWGPSSGVKQLEVQSPLGLRPSTGTLSVLAGVHFPHLSHRVDAVPDLSGSV